MNFEELQRQLISDDFENQPPDLMERSRTHGETSSQEEEVSNVEFPFDLDDNGRICGRFENDKVINLSKRALSEAEVSVLSKGLKFVSTPKELDYSQIKIDLENFGRRLRLKWWFKDEEDFSEIPVFRPRSKFNPRHKDVAIEVYLSKIEDEIMKLSAVGKNFSNLTREEISALNGLKSDRTIVIKEADKGSGVVVWDREDYIREAEDQLGDPDVYLPLDSDPSDILHNVINQAMGSIRQRGDVDDKTLEYLMVNNPKLGRFYMLPKIHKRLNSIPGRPVISNSGFYTENFSEFLDFHLQPLAKSVRSYIKDTNHFLQKIQSLGNLPEDAILCTIDVVALYPSIPHNEGLRVLRKALDSRADRSLSTDSLMDLAEVVLTNNMFEFNGRFYHQIRGTAIGTKCAPPYSILFLADLEEKLLHSYDFKPSVWWRYIDDVFLIWTHGEEELQKFVDYLNASHHSIKFTAEWSKESINFLDTRVIKKDNTLVTDLYTKPTDTHQLLHRSSCHPYHTKKGIPYGQALRIRRICSEDSSFKEHLASLKSWLMDRGYKGGEIDTQLERVKGLQRDTLLNRESKSKDGTRIPIVLTFHPALNEVHEILRKCENILLVDREHRRVFSGKLFVSFRKAKNFKDTLVRAKLQPENEELVEKGTHKCNGRRCQICPMMQEGSMFYNADDSRFFRNFSGAYDCNSENVVCLLQCTCCNKKYVGSTKTKFRQRFNVYKSYFRTYKQKRLSGNLHTGKPVPQASFFSQFFEQDHRGEFSVKISIIDGAGDVYSLRRKELFWQYKLGVFSPKGLNERVADIELDLFACGSA